MELILKQTISTLGQEGDIVTVKPGYGRNYLLPQRKAVLATPANKALLEQNKAEIVARREAERKVAEELSKKISGMEIVIEQLAGDDGRLFGSVTSADITAKLAEIRRMGVSIALDDFGTGYSSLSVLKQLNVDRLKIDRTFIREIDSSGDVNGIATLIVALGRQLNLSIIAEGVETPEQRVCLRAMGCQEGQGYLFARPLTAKQLEAWLATGQSQD